MVHPKRSRKERGVALLIALFALLLLSAIGLAMMYRADMETSISSNYRDLQTVTYAAMAGAQEARDRIHPSAGDIPAPLGLPAGSVGNVIYIINPQATESVQPWLNSNKYADTELCRETLASGFCNGSALPSGSSWYRVYDNSAGSYSGPYKETSPLIPYKWARITLKSDNMISGVPTRTAADGTQVCWDGANQVAKPALFGSNCGPTSGVISVTITDQGSAYSSNPTVTIDPPAAGGTTATATATVTMSGDGGVTNVTVANPGAAYTSAPTISFSGGGGSGAAATATIVRSGAPVSSVDLGSPGTACYTGGGANAAFSGGGGSGATANVTLGGATCIAGWNVTGTCSNYKGQTVPVSVTGGGGAGFSGTITFKNGNGKVTGVAVTNPGSGYTGNPTTVTGLGGGCTVTIDGGAWQKGAPVTGITLTNGGGGYLTPPSVVFDPPLAGGSSPSASATLGTQPPNAGQISAITVTNSGSGYTFPPTVTFTGGNGAGAVGIASVAQATGKVTSINITNSGSGYTAPPNVTISGGSGTGASATANIQGGFWLGQVFVITSFAQTSSGARAMTQMEVATPPRGIALGGALTLGGAAPTFGTPHSNNYYIDGHDANTCGETAYAPRPSIGTFDDPNNPTTPSAVDTIIAALARPDHYIGQNASPDVENVFGSMGDTMGTVAGLQSVTNAVRAAANGVANQTPRAGGVYDAAHPPDTGSADFLGDANHPMINFVDGDLSMGPSTGYGILFVTGTLSFHGNYGWNGLIFVIGDGAVQFSGGGNGQVSGSVFVANINNPNGNRPGPPTFDQNGGGGNGIRYDHCWADNLLGKIPIVGPPPNQPLKVLSVHTVTF